MALISLQDVDMGYGGPLLLEKGCLSIEKGERICLLGRNGNGKTSLMKLIAGELEPLSGQIVRQPNLKIARLIQQVPQNITGSVYHEVTRGLGHQGILINQYHDLSVRLEQYPSDENLLIQHERLAHKIEAAGGWNAQQKVEMVISKMQLDPELKFESLSAGLKRRVLLAKALVSEPDLLLLDEPTNHLDIESIDWIEKFLSGCNISLLFITHDRSFLKKLATRIVEIDSGQLYSFSCDYEIYLKRKDDIAHAQEVELMQFNKKLAQEEVWIRKGIQARRTRNEGRVRALKKMREEKQQLRKKMGNVKFQLQQSNLSGQLVFDIKNLSFAYDHADTVIRDFSSMIMRGDKIGIIGPNGSGKTTLLNLILGNLKPTTGSVKIGTNLEVAYFDQLHAQLDDSKTLIDNVADGYKNITINGQSRSVIGYLEDFLFVPYRSRSQVSSLSGGERNRLLLAKIFAKPSNVLVLDEPTNDLDIETLELLEELLAGYQGTVLMVSHDREFLNNVVTSTFVLQGGGVVKEYVGGYDDYIRQMQAQFAACDESAKIAVKQLSKPQSQTSSQESLQNQAQSAQKSKPAKLSYKLQRELDEIPSLIESAEKRLKELYDKIASPDFYKQDQTLIAGTNDEIAAAQAKLEQMYNRWDELESMTN